MFQPSLIQRPMLFTSLIGVMLTSIGVADDKSPAKGVHLFLLSGQSNMAGLRPAESFTPAVERGLGKESVIVVHDAVGGQPIRRWYKQWKSADGKHPESRGDLYDRLMKKAQAAVGDRKLASVTFIWMQGERDARERHGGVYQASLEGLVEQVKRDLRRDQINVVIGRLSDFGLTNKQYADWAKIREAQESFAKAQPNRVWVDTDDLNDGLNRAGKKIQNDLHYSAEGYKTLGTRFADESMKLIKGEVE